MSNEKRAFWIAGVLAADRRLTPDMSSDEVATALAELLGPATVWGTTVPDEEGWEPFEQAVQYEPVPWMTPDAELVDASLDALDAGWSVVEQLSERPTYHPPVLRTSVPTLDDVAELRRLGRIDGLDLSGYIRRPNGPWIWRWPLEVGVAAADLALATVRLRGTGEYAEHYEIFDALAEPERPCDVAIVDARLIDRFADPDRPVGLALVIGDDRASRVTSGLDAGATIGAGAMAGLPHDDLSWFEEFVIELTHDRPIDAALAAACPGAVLVGTSAFITMTSLRHWARTAGRIARAEGDIELAGRLNGIIEFQRFDHEVAGGRQIRIAVEDAELTGYDVRVRGSDFLMGAPPPPEPPASATPASPTAPPPPPPPPPAAAPVHPPKMTAPPRPAPAPPPPAMVVPSPSPKAPAQQSAPETSRRMVARVSDSTGAPSGFVAGRTCLLSLRLAAAAAAGQTLASAPMRSPLPDITIDLDVAIYVAGWTAPALVSMQFPQAGDGEWTVPIAFDPPPPSSLSADRMLDVYITVQWKGRVIQSATLSGRVHDAAETVDTEMTFVVDESAGLDDPDRRTSADATLVQTPGAAGGPVILDASSTVAIDPSVLERANAQVRRALTESFERAPTALADSAEALTELAVRGSLLRDALRGKNTSFFDDASWIHVMTFGGPPIHFELIYTHPMPRGDDVAICAPAVEGATSCAGDCADRDREDRVCPFGFWGTTKIIERRLHSPGRGDASASEERVVSVRNGAAVALTDLVDAEDDTASVRIGEAISAFVQDGQTAAATNWSELEAALDTPRELLCLVTHTIDPADPDDDLGVELQVGTESQKLHLVDHRYVNPDRRTPGPVVIALGCDTGTISASFATFVARLHSLGAEIVMTANAQIPGKEAADFVVRFIEALDTQLAGAGDHRFGAAMTAARAATLCQGDLLALALTASGDGDVRLAGTV